MLVTEVRCDRCGKTITNVEKSHTIQWRDLPRETESGDSLTADLCEDCYSVIVEQDLAQYSYKSALDLSLFNRGSK